MIVSLTGFMGSGKSSVGKVLAEKLSCPFVDLDSLIETGEGRSIPDIFASGGESLFRSLELKYLDSFLKGAAAPVSAEAPAAPEVPAAPVVAAPAEAPEVPAAEPSSVCSNCGAVGETGIFCTKCGAKLK